MRIFTLFMKNFVLTLFAMFVLVICSGCLWDNPVTSESDDPETEMSLVTAGALRQAEGEFSENVAMAPAIPRPKEIEITYWRDWNFREQILPEDSLSVGDTVYTRVVFPKDVNPIVYGDGEAVRPYIESTVARHLRTGVLEVPVYRMRGPKTRNESLASGEAKPWRNTKHIFLCKYVMQENEGGFPVFFISQVNSSGAHGPILLIEHPNIYKPTSEPTEFTYVPGRKQHPTDFVGQVVTPSSVRRYTSPVSGARVTVISGPQSGEQVYTDSNGYYRFPKVRGDSLHIQIEKEFLETKEAIVHRSDPTSLPNGFSLDRYRKGGDPQQHPGVVLLGYEWPEDIRRVFEQVTMVPDLLFSVDDLYSDGPEAGIYTDGIATVNEGIFLDVIFHEIAHAHQDAVADDGIGSWKHTPEGRAFAAAQEKDWKNVGKTEYDQYPYFRDSLLENAAETISIFWMNELGMQTKYDLHAPLSHVAPNRYKWAKKWLSINP